MLWITGVTPIILFLFTSKLQMFRLNLLYIVREYDSANQHNPYCAVCSDKATLNTKFLCCSTRTESTGRDYFSDKILAKRHNK